VRICFLGSDAFAVPSLDALAAAGHEVALVVTNPDRRRGRKSALLATPVKEEAARLGAPVHQPEGKPGAETAARIAASGAELGVVVAYGQLLTRAVRAAPSLGYSINVHASLLPRWRGAAPVAAAIRAGDALTGVSVQRVERRLDAGPVLVTREVPIEADATRGGLRDVLAQVGAEALVEAVARIAAGQAEFTAQDEALATHAPILAKDDGAVSWDQPADLIERTVRAFSPWPLAFADLGGKVGRVQLLRARRAALPAERADAPPGTHLGTTDEGLLVMTGEGALELLEVRRAGKRAASGCAFARGLRARPGELLC